MQGVFWGDKHDIRTTSERQSQWIRNITLRDIISDFIGAHLIHCRFEPPWAGLGWAGLGWAQLSGGWNAGLAPEVHQQPAAGTSALTRPQSSSRAGIWVRDKELEMSDGLYTSSLLFVTAFQWTRDLLWLVPEDYLQLAFLRPTAQPFPRILPQMVIPE